jgi:hypothetical protein
MGRLCLSLCLLNLKGRRDSWKSCLLLQFDLKIGSMYMEQEVYGEDGHLTQIILMQKKDIIGNGAMLILGPWSLG